MLIVQGFNRIINEKLCFVASMLVLTLVDLTRQAPFLLATRALSVFKHQLESCLGKVSKLWTQTTFYPPAYCIVSA